MHHVLLAAALLAVSASLAIAQGLQNPDPAFRSSVDPRLPAAGGGSETQPVIDPHGRRVVQERVGSGAGNSSSTPSNQGVIAGVRNEVPRGAVSNEGNPR